MQIENKYIAIGAIFALLTIITAKIDSIVYINYLLYNGLSFGLDARIGYFKTFTGFALTLAWAIPAIISAIMMYIGVKKM